MRVSSGNTAAIAETDAPPIRWRDTMPTRPTTRACAVIADHGNALPRSPAHHRPQSAFQARLRTKGDLIEFQTSYRSCGLERGPHDGGVRSFCDPGGQSFS